MASISDAAIVGANTSSNSVLTSRKCSSTPSLPQATADKTSDSSVPEQAVSDDNLSVKQAAEAIAESVVNVASAEALLGASGDTANRVFLVDKLASLVSSLAFGGNLEVMELSSLLSPVPPALPQRSLPSLNEPQGFLNLSSVYHLMAKSIQSLADTDSQALGNERLSKSGSSQAKTSSQSGTNNSKGPMSCGRSPSLRVLPSAVPSPASSFDPTYPPSSSPPSRGNYNFNAGEVQLAVAGNYNFNAGEVQLAVAGNYNFNAGSSNLLLQVPLSEAGGDWQLRVDGRTRVGGSLIFSQTANLTYSPTFLTILIQPSRPVYNAGQTVRFRAILLTRDLKPYDEPVDVFVLDSHGRVMRRWPSMQTGHGVVTLAFELPQYPVLGRWRLRVEALAQVEDKTFLVEQYFRPRFEVFVRLPHTVKTVDERLTGVVVANMTNWRHVHGNCSLLLQSAFHSKNSIPSDADFSTVYNEFIHNFQGVHPFDFDISGLVSTSSGEDLDLSLRVVADVGDVFGWRIIRGWAIARVVHDEAMLQILGDQPLVFRPGMPITVHAFASYADHHPFDEEELEQAKVTITLYVSGGTSQVESAEISGLDLVEQGGVAKAVFDIPELAETLKIDAQFKSTSGLQAASTALGTKHHSPRDYYLQVETSSQDISPGDYIVLHVRNNFKTDYINFIMSGSGVALYTDRTAVTDKNLPTVTTFAIPASTEMAPVARVTVWAVADDGQLVTHAIAIPVNPLGRHEVGIRWNDHKDHSGGSSEWKMLGEIGSFFGVSSLWEETNFLDAGHDLDESRVLHRMMGLGEDAILSEKSSRARLSQPRPKNHRVQDDFPYADAPKPHIRRAATRSRDGGGSKVQFFPTSLGGPDVASTFAFADLLLLTDTTVYYQRSHAAVILQPGEFRDVSIPIVFTGMGEVMVTGVTIQQHTSRLLDLKNRGLVYEFLDVDLDESPIIPYSLERRYIYDTPAGHISITGDVVGPSFPEIPVTTDIMLGMELMGAEAEAYNFAANLWSLHYLRLTNQLDSSMTYKVLNAVAVHYAAIARYQNADGSFSMFPGDEAGVWLTAHVLKTLLVADFQDWENHLYIDRKILSTAASWLIDHQTSDGSFAETPYYQDLEPEVDPNKRKARNRSVALTAHALLALVPVTPTLQSALRVRANSAITSAISYLDRKLPSLVDPYDVAVVAWALTKAGAGGADAAFARLASMKRTEGSRVYWSREPIGTNPLVYEDSQRPFIQPKDDQKWDAHAVETTAYALLLYVERESLGVVQESIVRFLAEMRKTDGGHITTVDSVVALEALVAYSYRARIRDITDLHVRFEMSTNPNQTLDVHLSNDGNLAAIRSFDLETIYGHINVIGHGSGQAIVQLEYTYAVDQPDEMDYPPVDAYDLEIKAQYSGRNQSHINITACQRWTCEEDGETSGLAITSIHLPSGYYVMQDDLIRLVDSRVVPNLRWAVRTDTTVDLYFSRLTEEWTCVSYQVERWHAVSNHSRYNAAAIYSHFQPERFNQTLFEVYSLYDLDICEVCGSFQCPYCPFYSGGFMPTPSMWVWLPLLLVWGSVPHLWTHR
ncbi:CD109 antigen [Hyalella azteca]|uniref:CD109 antigen n=1 Tax=Hyalella azteca TaxID=294128 RepID=A0A979FTU2_HYAAZ|nr:CD109 antigen [Hyalella azteca]